MPEINDHTSILEKTTIRIAGAIQESIVDGPGIRYVIFTQGCPFHCKGCHNPQAQSLSGGIDVKLNILYEEIISDPLIKGVTFSGGEPFIQSSPLVILSKFLKEKGYSIWSYSGFIYEKLASDPIYLKLLKEIDVLVDGPFILAKKSLELDFRGSSNQRIIDVKESLNQNKVILMKGFK